MDDLEFTDEQLRVVGEETLQQLEAKRRQAWLRDDTEGEAWIEHQIRNNPHARGSEQE